jgi:hypothetical protein
VTTLGLPMGTDLTDERGGPRGALADLLLGARLSVAGRRSGWVRMLLTAVGTAIGVSVLLFAASIPHVLSTHDARVRALSYAPYSAPVAGVAPLHLSQTRDLFRGSAIDVEFVRAQGPTAPVPPGLSRVPGPGEAFYSPALSRLLAADDSDLLRARYPFRQVGVIADSGLTSPRELSAYVGSSDLRGSTIYRYGSAGISSSPLPPLLWALLTVGIVVLLFPVVVFVVTCSRLSGTQRDRRLAAIRLVGATAGQARLIAAGEALVAAPVGVLLGAVIFLLARPIAEHQELFGLSPFASDIVPSAPLVVLIVVAVPVFAVVAALVALRRTLIEPLGVMRESGTRRLRLWWRIVPPLAGLPLLYEVGRPSGSTGSSLVLVLGVVLVLLGIPLLLPWIVQRMLIRTRSETLALQLATGRLRADASTAARVVAGLGVVLAGAISFSTLLFAAQDRYSAPIPGAATDLVVDLYPGTAAAARGDQVAARLAAVPGVTGLTDLRRGSVAYGADQGAMIVAPCPVLLALAHVPFCVDGQVFVGGDRRIQPGSRVRAGLDDSGKGGVGLTVPANAAAVTGEILMGDLLVDLYLTPGAARAVPASTLTRLIHVAFDQTSTDTPDLIRNAAGAVSPDGMVQDGRPGAELDPDARTYLTIRRGLFAGAVLTLGVAGATMLVLAVEQIRERRRPLAALAAAGVPRALLTRSLLWQNAIPVLLAVLLADVVGVVMGALLEPIAGETAHIAWSSIGLLSALTVLVVAAVTALTLPAVRKATRPTTLRAE